MSRRALALLATLAALFAAAAPASAARPQDLALRLADLGPSYFIPDRSCVATRLRGDGTSRVVDQVGRLPHRGCEIRFYRAWVAPGASAGPHDVSSRALVFDDAAGPELALTRPRAVASFMSLPPHEELEVVEPAPAIGDEAVLLRGPEKPWRREARWSATVLWRSGNVLAAIEATGEDSFDATAQAALRLAAAQQARIAAPTPLGPADNDQSEVGLGDPGFGLPVWWLGHDLAARGRLPSLSLIASVPQQLYRRDAMVLAYGRRDIGIALRLTHPRILRQPIIRGLLQIIDQDPCMHRKRLALPQGRATIWLPRGRRCDDRRPLAVARLPGVVVTVNVDIRQGPLARYATRAGMLRLLRALRPRPELAEPPAPAG